MKRAILLAIAILPMALCAQTSDEFPRFELGAGASYNFAYRSLKVSTPSSSTEAIVKDLEANERQSYLPHFSMPFSWNAASHWRINSGAIYAIRGFETKFSEPNVVDPQIPKKSRFIYRTSWLEIPITTDYFIWERTSRFNLFVRAGIQFSLNTSEKTTFEKVYDSRTEFEEVSSIDKPRKSLVYMTVGIGSQYRLSKKLNIELAFLYQRGLTPVNPELGFNGEPAQINTYYWNLGAQIAVKYSID